MQTQVGEDIWYALPTGKRAGEFRPAKVARINEDGTLEVFVFLSIGDELDSPMVGPVKVDEPGPKNEGRSLGTCFFYLPRDPKEAAAQK